MIRDAIIDLFGQYTPITYTQGSETIIPAGAAGVDWVFIAGVLLFALSFYCVFRVLGGIFKHVIGN